MQISDKIVKSIGQIPERGGADELRYPWLLPLPRQDA